MTKSDLKGLVIYMNDQKDLIQTKRIRVCQREKLADKCFFLIPKEYNYEDLSKYTVLLIYQGPDLSARTETLIRLSDGQGGYEDYEDSNGNATYMIYHLDIDSNFTLLAGDVTLSLSLQYVDYEMQTSSEDDEHESSASSDPVQHVINTQETIVPVLPIKDYYSVIDDTRLSILNQKIADLDAAQKRLEATAEVYDQSKGDSIEMHIDKYSQCIRLLSHGRPVGEEIDLNDLGDAISDWQEAGLVKVITEDDEPEPTPTPSDEYANDIVLVVDEQTRAIYLLSNGKKIGNPIYLEDLGTAISDATEAGLIKVITDDDSGTTVITDDD